MSWCCFTISNIAKIILLKQGLWLVLPSFIRSPSSIAKIILLKQGLWLIIPRETVFSVSIAKIILLKQGLWLYLRMIILIWNNIAKIILLKQGLWLIVKSTLNTASIYCKDYSIKTRNVTLRRFLRLLVPFQLQRLFY